MVTICKVVCNRGGEHKLRKTSELRTPINSKKKVLGNANATAFLHTAINERTKRKKVNLTHRMP